MSVLVQRLKEHIDYLSRERDGAAGHSPAMGTLRNVLDREIQLLKNILKECHEK